MHPAYSVIIFTAASGAGYGLLVWLALSVLVTPLVPVTATSAMLGFGVAFTLITVGLISSTLHLGRPERAWRAMSQWRTSWLSREGALAIITYPVAGLFAATWLFAPTGAIIQPLLALATVACAVATLWCTGMIYASLPTIRAWHMPHVAPLYILLGLATGGMLHFLLSAIVAGSSSPFATILTLVALVAAYVVKTDYWHTIDTAKKTYTAGAATGLSSFGQVRAFDPPHSRANYVMREMGFEVARKHALKLRFIVQVALFAVPAVCLMLGLLAGPTLSLVLAVIAVAAAGAGILTERWLFFAEAEHVVVIYYGKDAA